MTTVTYSDDQGAFIATVEAPDEIKAQLFDAYMAKMPWLVKSRWYDIRGMRISRAGAESREIHVTIMFLHWDDSGE